MLLLASVIPVMDRIDKVLATDALKQEYSLCIRAALSVGKKTLNQYYGKTDHLDLYHIAMGKLLNYHNLLVFHSKFIPFQFFIQATNLTTSAL